MAGGTTKLSGGGVASLYALKAVAAFMVVAIHFPMAGRYALYPLIYTAVPLFLVISGYFLYSDDTGRIVSGGKKRLRKAVAVALTANAVYYLYGLVISLADGKGVIPPFYSLYDVVYWLLFGFNFSGPLWYMTAYVWTLVIIVAACRIGLSRLLPLSLLSFVFFNFLYPYRIIDINLPWCFEVNFISTGLPWVCTGMLLRKYERKIGRLLSNKTLTILLLATLCLRYIEHYSYGAPNPRALLNVPLVILLFIACLRAEGRSVNGSLVRIGKRHSQNIYLWHSLTGGILVFLAGRCALPAVPEPIFAPVVFAVTLGLSALAERLCAK